MACKCEKRHKCRTPRFINLRNFPDGIRWQCHKCLDVWITRTISCVMDPETVWERVWKG